MRTAPSSLWTQRQPATRDRLLPAATQFIHSLRSTVTPLTRMRETTYQAHCLEIPNLQIGASQSLAFLPPV